MPPARVVGVLEQANHYQASLYEGVRSVLEPLGIPLLLVACDPFRPTPAPTLRWAMQSLRPTGIIRVPLARAEDDEAVDRMLAQYPQIEVVHLGQRVDGPCAHADNETGMRLLVRHLTRGAGITRPLVVRGTPHQQDSIVRERIVREELAAAGVTLDEDLVVEGRFQRHVAYQAVREVLCRRHDFDAVIAFNDRSALGAMDAVLQAGLRIPQDVLVTGFDNEDLAELSEPPLTSVDQQLHEQGAWGARLLLSQIAGERTGPRKVPTELVVRESSVRDEAQLSGGTQRRQALVARLWGEVAALDATLALNRTFMSCGSVGETAVALSDAMTRIGARRGFLVLLDRDADGVQIARVGLVHRDGGPGDTIAERWFDPALLLPEHLAPELTAGTLALHPLSTEDAELGYVLLELTGADRFVSEALRMDLTRTFERQRRTAELAAHAENLERLVAERTRELQAEVSVRRRTEEELQRLNADLQLRLHEDGLTGLSNRVGLDVALEDQWRVVNRLGGALSLLMIDVDHFKRFNDTYGHLAGDEALRAVARCLDDGVHRPLDVAARYGGEEFAVVLPNTPSSGARAIAARIRSALALADVPHTGSPQGRLTVSIGIATTYPGPIADPASLVAEADAALYAAKANGRDQFVVSEGGVLIP